jgi:hypothetical protein
MADIQVTLTADETEYLRNLLETTLKNTLVEEHRTRTPTFREHVLRQETILQSLLTKLRQSV